MSKLDFMSPNERFDEQEFRRKKVETYKLFNLRENFLAFEEKLSGQVDKAAFYSSWGNFVEIYANNAAGIRRSRKKSLHSVGMISISNFS